MSVKQKDQLLAALADSDNATGIFTKSELLEVAEAAGLSSFDQSVGPREHRHKHGIPSR